MYRNYIRLAGLAISLLTAQSAVGMCEYALEHAIDEMLFKAAYQGDVQKAEWWIDGGACLNYLGLHSFTPLHSAAEKGHSDVVRLLVSCGADVNAWGARDIRPLHKAALGSRVDLVEYLVDKGAEVDALDRRGNTALHYAVAGNNGKRASIALVRRGADLLKSNKNFQTPLDLIAEDSSFKQALFKEWCIKNRYKEPCNRAFTRDCKIQEKQSDSLISESCKAHIPYEAK